MKSFCLLAAVLIAVSGKVIFSHPVETNDVFLQSFEHKQRERLPRDLYSNKFGYEHNIYDGDKGKVDARIYGEHSHNPRRGDSTKYGTGATWHDDNAHASVDYTHEKHGKDHVSATGGGSWKVGENGKFYIEGQYQH